MNENDRLQELIWKNELLRERVQRLEAEKEILQMKLEKSKNLPTFYDWPYTNFLNSTCGTDIDITQSFEKFKKNNPSITPDFKDALDAMANITYTDSTTSTGLKEGLEEGEKMESEKKIIDMSKSKEEILTNVAFNSDLPVRSTALYLMYHPMRGVTINA